MAYFSNGSEGEILDQQCCDCIVNDDAPCPVLFVQMEFNYDQLKKGNESLQKAMNILIDKKGICQMKKVLDTQSGPPACLQRKLVFGDEEQIAAVRRLQGET